MTKDAAPKKVFQTLLTPHSHAMQDCVEGDVIEVRADQAERLKAAGTSRDATPEEIKQHQGND